MLIIDHFDLVVFAVDCVMSAAVSQFYYLRSDDLHFDLVQSNLCFIQ